jgi:two-component system phosphate regulon sensor histidine kinase PhoR
MMTEKLAHAHDSQEQRRGLRWPRTLVPRIGITWKVYLWGLLVLLFAFLIVAGTSWIIAGDQARTHIEVEIDGSLKGFQADFDQQTKDLETVGRWMVGQPSFVELVQARDSAGLTSYLQPWTQASIIDALTVTDSQGLVLTRVRLDQPIIQGDNILTSAGIPEALKGQASSGIEQDMFGRLQGRLILPVYADKQAPPIGALVLAFFLDGDFLKHASNEGSSQVAIAYRDNILASTLTDQQGKPWIGWPVPAEVIVAERENRTSQAVIVPTTNGNYLFKFKPLQSPAHQTIGMYGLGLSLTSIEAERTALFRPFGLGFLVASLVIGVATYFFARVFIYPIRSLQTAAEGIARGDLSTNITLPRRDELGDLARRMEHMRQQLQHALQTAGLEKSRYEAIIRCMGVAAIVTDDNHQIVAANPAAELVLQQSQADLINHPWQDIFNPAGQSDYPIPSFWDLESPGRIGKTVPVIHGRFRLRAQPRVLLDVISSAVQIRTESAGSVHMIQDVSAQEQMLRSKDEFVLNLAHELRGPTASLRALIEVLREDYANMSKRDAKLLLETLQRATVKFQRLVENLIDFGTVQAGQFHVRPVPTELGEIVKEAVSQVKGLVKTNEQTLELNLDPNNIIVLADEPRAIQVIVNLLTNASKYGPENEPITVSTRREGDFVRIEVTDHGPGIPPEAQLHIFERFYRVKRARDEAIGIGLGLALAKAIVETHGGQIGVESEVGRGSTFWFTLPEVK